MSPFGCVRERETAEVLERGQWPHACSDELRAVESHACAGTPGSGALCNAPGESGGDEPGRVAFAERAVVEGATAEAE